ncbi:MAG: DNA mismatch repair endonuclease MutL [Desulfobulbaceae bacterium]|nr:DNA mismatch repair endonuclease MutL [Desulfobulbaceae bacterium]
MSRIRILSEHLANQIAAGEVVERPASVVKELMENSLDAAATRVDVQVEGSGVRLIRVMDNGEGMDEDDVLLCIERHATSKLYEENQLGSIATLGFRGEAIPSIGSVSRMTILSRPQGSETGTRAEIRYGALHAVHEDGCSRGTIIEVRNLLGNMPARKKFLKSARTELYHIEEVLRNQALAYPETDFSLQVEGRMVMDFQAGGDLETRVREVFRYQDDLLPLENFAEEHEHPGLLGLLLLPEASSPRTARLRILVNRRPVQDRMIRHAIAEGLQGFLMKGHQPAGVLLLDISPELVDVNVHPAKREIRFRNGQEVHRFVVRIVAGAMRAYQEQVRSDLFSSPGVSRPAVKHQPPIGAQAFPRTEEPTPQDQDFMSVRSPQTSTSRPAEPVPSFQYSASPQVDTQPVSFPSTATSASEHFNNLILIGQLFDLYLLCEKKGELVVIDQHAAHERILYGRLRQGYLDREIPAQNLLFPASIELGPDHIETLESRGDEVASLGLVVEPFGDVTWVIKAVPVPVSHLEPADILVDVLDGLRTGSRKEGGPIPPVIDHLMASMACKAAIKAGDRLQPEEMLELLQQMEASDVFSHCPHGRPVIKVFSQYEIEKWFCRV